MAMPPTAWAASSSVNRQQQMPPGTHNKPCGGVDPHAVSGGNMGGEEASRLMAAAWASPPTTNDPGAQAMSGMPVGVVQKPNAAEPSRLMAAAWAAPQQMMGPGAPNVANPPHTVQPQVLHQQFQQHPQQQQQQQQFMQQQQQQQQQYLLMQMQQMQMQQQQQQQQQHPQPQQQQQQQQPVTVTLDQGEMPLSRQQTHEEQQQQQQMQQHQLQQQQQQQQQQQLELPAASTTRKAEAARHDKKPDPASSPSVAGTATVDGASDVDSSGLGKGVISLLQEFVQCSRQFHAPQHRTILQWSFDHRMIDYTALAFRATVAFLLDGIPHHVAGEWHPSKKFAQRDAAERALRFFVGKWGEQLLLEQQVPTPKPSTGVQGTDDTQVLHNFCGSYSACQGLSPSWSHEWDNNNCVAIVDIVLLGVPHKFAGSAKPTEKEAREDTARRVLWYMQCPGYENAFNLDPRAPALMAKDIPAPPANWAGSSHEGEGKEAAEKKTTLMRVQNRLQQAFARFLRAGQSVWEWSYESDENDTSWPPLSRATVVIPVANKSFTGDWTRGQREAQINACSLVSAYLDEEQGAGNASRTLSSWSAESEACGGN